MNGKRRCHVFGPVASRRLGRSLGVDPVPFKTCSFDCIYCECGRTTNSTRRRSEYVPANEILEDVAEAIRSLSAKALVETVLMEGCEFFKGRNI